MPVYKYCIGARWTGFHMFLKPGAEDGTNIRSPSLPALSAGSCLVGGTATNDFPCKWNQVNERLMEDKGAECNQMQPCPNISECIRLAICTGSSLEMQPCPKKSESIRLAIYTGSSLDLGISPTSFNSEGHLHRLHPFQIMESYHGILYSVGC